MSYKELKSKSLKAYSLKYLDVCSSAKQVDVKHKLKISFVMIVVLVVMIKFIEMMMMIVVTLIMIMMVMIMEKMMMIIFFLPKVKEHVCLWIEGDFSINVVNFLILNKRRLHWSHKWDLSLPP